jgi:hypothetical protein
MYSPGRPEAKGRADVSEVKDITIHVTPRAALWTDLRVSVTPIPEDYSPLRPSDWVTITTDDPRYFIFHWELVEFPARTLRAELHVSRFFRPAFK